MHDRDMIWKSEDGRRIPIKDLTTAHLINVLKFINDRVDAFIARYGKKGLEYLTFNITQEIRLRKLNRIKIDNQEELF